MRGRLKRAQFTEINVKLFHLDDFTIELGRLSISWRVAAGSLIEENDIITILAVECRHVSPVGCSFLSRLISGASFYLFH